MRYRRLKEKHYILKRITLHDYREKSNGFFKIDMPKNEPVHSYLPGSKERESLKKEVARQSATVEKIPLIIGGKEVWTEKTDVCVMPHDHDHAHVLCEYCVAGEKELKMAIDAAM